MKPTAIYALLVMCMVFAGCGTPHKSKPELNTVDETIKDFKRMAPYQMEPIDVDFDVSSQSSADRALEVFLSRFPRGYYLFPDAKFTYKGLHWNHFYWIAQDDMHNWWVIVIQKDHRRFYIRGYGPRYTEMKTTEPNQALEPTTLSVTFRAFARPAPARVAAHL
jgi:hypothetical protein